jgi:ketosteroid isomerase-like protein
MILRRSDSGMGTYTLHDVPIALRGDRLALTHRTARVAPGENVVEMLAVNEIDAEGRITRWATFDGDDLVAAYAQLDDWYIDGEGAEHADIWRLVCAWRDAFNARDWEALSRLLHPETVVIDHNLHGYEARGPGEVRALSEAIAAAEPAHVLRFQRIDGVGRAGVVFTVSTEPTSAGGDEFATHFLNVLGIHQGMVRSCDIYPPERLTEARARLTELEAADDARSVPRNRASEVFRRAVEALAKNDQATFDAVHVPGFVNDDRRYRRAGMEFVIEGAEPIFGDPIGTATGMDNLVLATRGEDLALHRNVYRGRRRDGFEWEVETLAVAELADDGRIAATVAFDGTDVDAAYTELDRRYLARIQRDSPGLERVWSTVCRFAEAFNRRDWAAYNATLAADYTMADHRMASFGTMDVATAQRLAIEVVGLSPSLRFRFMSVTDVSATAVIMRANGDVDFDYDKPTWMVVNVKEDVVARLDLFAADDEVGAWACFARLQAPLSEDVPP